MSGKNVIIFTLSIIAIAAIVLFINQPSNIGKNTQSQDYNISFSSADVVAKYFGKEVIEKTMKQNGCTQIRMYYSKQNDGTSALVVSGMDKDGKELIASLLPKPCPPGCNAPRS